MNEWSKFHIYHSPQFMKEWVEDIVLGSVCLSVRAFHSKTIHQIGVIFYTRSGILVKDSLDLDHKSRNIFVFFLALPTSEGLWVLGHCMFPVLL